MAVVGSATRVSAQSIQTGALEVRITSDAGQPVGDVTVRLQMPDGAYPRTARSNAQGEVRMLFVQPGIYTLDARGVGLRPAVVTDIRVQATETRRLGITMVRTSTTLTPVAVSASALAINRTSTAFPSTLTAAERERLPTGRSINDLIAFTAGARPGQVFGGSTNQANLYQLDGVTINAPGTGGSFLLPSVDWMDAFSVIGLGAGADYGNFQGGLIAMVTKSGTNTPQGAVRAFVEAAAFNAVNVNAFEQGAEQATRQELSAEGRGPLVRDKLYYYVSGVSALARQRVVDVQRSTAGRAAWLPTTMDRREDKAYGKVTWQATSRDIVNASLGLDGVTRAHIGLNGYDAVDATMRGQSPSLFYQANWQRLLGTRSALELRASGYRGADDQLPYQGGMQPSVRLLDVSGSPQYANGIWTRTNRPDVRALALTFDHMRTTGTVQHQIKVGGEYSLGDWRERRVRNGGVSWYTQPKAGTVFNARDASTWGPIPSVGGGVYATADTGGSIDLVAQSTNAAVFLQDDARLGERVTLHAGVRVGAWRGDITPGNGGGSRGTSSFTAVQATGVDPRIGATVDLTGKGTFVAKAYWGRYHQNLFALFFDRAPGANAFTPVGYCDWRVSNAARPDPTRAYTAAELAAASTCRAGASVLTAAAGFENYRQPYMDQWTIGLEKALSPHLTATLLVITRANRSVLALVDRRAAANWKPLHDVAVYDAFGPVKDMQGAPLVLSTVYVRADDLRRRLAFGTQYSNQIPGYSAADTLTLPSVYAPDLVVTPVDAAHRQFRQVQLGVTGSYPWGNVAATFTRTHLTGNVFSVDGYFNPDGQDNGPFVEPNRAMRFDGPLDNFSPWELKARATAALPWSLEGGAFLTVRTGDRWTPTYTMARDANYRVMSPQGEELALNAALFAGTSGQQIFVESRGARQLPTQAQLDLRLERSITVRRQVVRIGAEVFNVFNGQAMSAVKTSLNNQMPGDPSSRPGAVRLRQQPLTLRVNTQLRF